MASLDVSSYSESLSSEDKGEYFAKLTLETGERLPDPFVLKEGWTDDMSYLPSLSWRDVTEYLIDSPSIYTKESMKAYKSLEAYDYFLCRHVQDCLYHNITEESDFCYIKTEGFTEYEKTTQETRRQHKKREDNTINETNTENEKTKKKPRPTQKTRRQKRNRDQHRKREDKKETETNTENEKTKKKPRPTQKTRRQKRNRDQHRKREDKKETETNTENEKTKQNREGNTKNDTNTENEKTIQKTRRQHKKRH
ncbi:translation initiation factor IF-2-like [Penaeus japonicus]|uniref:translation initiation factor IF-2-like n=1 Tax=Penaeus japonicus TaxID=27405 RepID=UPI001C710DA5|nr:translation initiation factor IF-2-like [Penaeus japonicus]